MNLSVLQQLRRLPWLRLLTKDSCSDLAPVWTSLTSFESLQCLHPPTQHYHSGLEAGNSTTQTPTQTPIQTPTQTQIPTPAPAINFPPEFESHHGKQLSTAAGVHAGLPSTAAQHATSTTEADSSLHQLDLAAQHSTACLAGEERALVRTTEPSASRHSTGDSFHQLDASSYAQHSSTAAPCTSKHSIAAPRTSQHSTATIPLVSQGSTATLCTPHHSTATACTSQHSTGIPCTSQQTTAASCTSQHSMVTSCTPQHSTASPCTPQHSTAAPCSPSPQLRMLDTVSPFASLAALRPLPAFNSDSAVMSCSMYSCPTLQNNSDSAVMNNGDSWFSDLERMKPNSSSSDSGSKNAYATETSSCCMPENVSWISNWGDSSRSNTSSSSSRDMQGNGSTVTELTSSEHVGMRSTGTRQVESRVETRVKLVSEDAASGCIHDCSLSGWEKGSVELGSLNRFLLESTTATCSKSASNAAILSTSNATSCSTLPNIDSSPFSTNGMSVNGRAPFPESYLNMLISSRRLWPSQLACRHMSSSNSPSFVASNIPVPSTAQPQPQQEHLRSTVSALRYQTQAAAAAARYRMQEANAVRPSHHLQEPVTQHASQASYLYTQEHHTIEQRMSDGQSKEGRGLSCLDRRCGTAEPHSSQLRTSEPQISHLQASELQISHLQTPEPQKLHNQTSEPQISHLQTSGPQISHLQTSEPQILHLQTSEPQILHLQTSEPQISHLQTSEPQISHLHTSEPQTSHLQTSEPHISHLQASEPHSSQLQTPEAVQQLSIPLDTHPHQLPTFPAAAEQLLDDLHTISSQAIPDPSTHPFLDPSTHPSTHPFPDPSTHPFPDPATHSSTHPIPDPSTDPFPDPSRAPSPYPSAHLLSDPPTSSSIFVFANRTKPRMPAIPESLESYRARALSLLQASDLPASFLDGITAHIQEGKVRICEELFGRIEQMILLQKRHPDLDVELMLKRNPRGMLSATQGELLDGMQRLKEAWPGMDVDVFLSGLTHPSRWLTNTKNSLERVAAYQEAFKEVLGIDCPPRFFKSRHSSFSNQRPETLRTKLKWMMDFMGKASAIRLVTLDPHVLTLSFDYFKNHVEQMGAMLDVPPARAFAILTKTPKLLSFNVARMAENMAFLGKELALENKQVSTMAFRFPPLLTASLASLDERIRCFEVNLQVDRAAAAKCFVSVPSLLGYSPTCILKKMAVIREVLELDDEGARDVLHRVPHWLTMSVEALKERREFQPKVLNVNLEQWVKIVINNPSVFNYRHETLVGKVDAMLQLVQEIQPGTTREEVQATLTKQFRMVLVNTDVMTVKMRLLKHFVERHPPWEAKLMQAPAVQLLRVLVTSARILIRGEYLIQKGKATDTELLRVFRVSCRTWDKLHPDFSEWSTADSTFRLLLNMITQQAAICNVSSQKAEIMALQAMNIPISTSTYNRWIQDQHDKSLPSSRQAIISWLRTQQGRASSSKDDDKEEVWAEFA